MCVYYCVWLIGGDSITLRLRYLICWFVVVIWTFVICCCYVVVYVFYYYVICYVVVIVLLLLLCLLHLLFCCYIDVYRWWLLHIVCVLRYCCCYTRYLNLLPHCIIITYRLRWTRCYAIYWFLYRVAFCLHTRYVTFDLHYYSTFPFVVAFTLLRVYCVGLIVLFTRYGLCLRYVTLCCGCYVCLRLLRCCCCYVIRCLLRLPRLLLFYTLDARSFCVGYGLCRFAVTRVTHLVTHAFVFITFAHVPTRTLRYAVLLRFTHPLFGCTCVLLLVVTDYTFVAY